MVLCVNGADEKVTDATWNDKTQVWPAVFRNNGDDDAQTETNDYDNDVHAIRRTFERKGLGAAPTEEFQLIAATVNVTSWGTGLKFLKETNANLVMMQEHKLANDDEIDEAGRTCDGLGWSSVWRKAKHGKREKDRSGGVAIFAKRGIGLTDDAILTEHHYRLVAAKVEAPGTPVFDAVATYFKVGKGLTGINGELAADIAHHAKRRARPGMVGGDYNMTPEAVAEGVAKLTDGRVLIPPNGQATCTAGTKHSQIDM